MVELPSPYAGVIAQLHAGEGDTVEVCSVLGSFGGGDDTAARRPRAARCGCGWRQWS
ncbi:hypothetical protein [Rhodococcus sp. ACS1]|uniref:hypothetical protein n=1 Tax=Rhodococcus sp. ACS1 TaxID=2028570 RepID=UPI00359C4434